MCAPLAVHTHWAHRFLCFKGILEILLFAGTKYEKTITYIKNGATLHAAIAYAVTYKIDTKDV